MRTVAKQQQCGHTVMCGGQRQRQRAHDHDRAEDELGDQDQPKQYARGTHRRRRASSPGQEAQHTQDDGGGDRAQPMHEVDSHARRMIQHAAFVIDAQASPQHERILHVHVRPIAVLAGREIRAGEGGVVTAGPAAEHDLQSQHRQTDTRQFAQLGIGRAPPLRAPCSVTWPANPAATGSTSHRSDGARRSAA